MTKTIQQQIRLSLNCCKAKHIRNTSFTALILTFSSAPVFAKDCFSPPKQLPKSSAQWYLLQQNLSTKTEDCLRSSVFFSLLGAAQLNSGQVKEAIASLERALLLDADNGAALIDYASALFHSGELFSAMDLNRQLIERDDLPAHIKPMLENRAKRWQNNTFKQQQELSIQSGYDSNINGATFIKDLTLNSQSGDITLPLKDSERAISSNYITLGASHQQLSLTAFRQKRFSVTSNVRLSEQTNSNYAQFTARYQDRYIQEQGFWYWEAGSSYLHYDDQALSSTVSLSLKKQWQEQQTCEPYIQGDLEYLRAIQQSELDALSLYSGIGLLCKKGSDTVEVRVGHTYNKALDSQRAGSDKKSWQVDFQWRRPLLKGSISSYLRHTSSRDDDGYNSLLKDNARRDVNRTDIAIEYSQPVNDQSQLYISLNKQQQNSNISLFNQRGTRIGVGFKKRF